LTKKIAIVLAALFALVAYCFAQEATAAKPSNSTTPLDAGVSELPFTFVAYGDIRFTQPDTPRKQAASDPARRKLLIEKIAEEKPAFVTISGDLVLNGEDKSDWQVWDRESKPLRDANIGIFPVIGNHELRGGDAALANYFERFPALQRRRWYSVRAQNCLFFMLDSNLNEEGSEQTRWLDDQLAHVPSDVQFVLFMLHHPLMTQSRDDMPEGEGIGRGGHSLRTQEARLAQTLEAARAKLNRPFIVIAGHVHNYEHYERNGVVYITSGGGGATPYRIDRKPGDFYTQTGPTYHYCTLKVSADKLEFKMHKLELADTKPVWSVADQFELKAPEVKKPAAKKVTKPAKPAPKKKAAKAK
jgi:predicted MPP superfamily phosphohydrolase